MSASIRIEQGRRMGRPGILEITADGARVEIPGSGIIAAQATIQL